MSTTLLTTSLVILFITGCHGVVNNININSVTPNSCNITGLQRLILEPGTDCTVKCSITFSTGNATIDFYELENYLPPMDGHDPSVCITNTTHKMCHSNLTISASKNFLHCHFTISNDYVNSRHHFYSKTLVVEKRQSPDPSSAVDFASAGPPQTFHPFSARPPQTLHPSPDFITPTPSYVFDPATLAWPTKTNIVQVDPTCPPCQDTIIDIPAVTETCLVSSSESLSSHHYIIFTLAVLMVSSLF